MLKQEALEQQVLELAGAVDESPTSSSQHRESAADYDDVSDGEEDDEASDGEEYDEAAAVDVDDDTSDCYCCFVGTGW